MCRNIRTLHNFDPPADSETYVHRVGRTGRAGRTGIGITLLTPDERHAVSTIASELGLDHGLPTRHPGKPGVPGGSAPRSAWSSRPRSRSTRRPRRAGRP